MTSNHMIYLYKLIAILKISLLLCNYYIISQSENFTKLSKGVEHSNESISKETIYS